jgi:hypothetical protein
LINDLRIAYDIFLAVLKALALQYLNYEVRILLVILQDVLAFGDRGAVKQRGCKFLDSKKWFSEQRGADAPRQ